MITNKQETRKMLEKAVDFTHFVYPVFQGVIGFGSFFNGKENPSDLDVIPVFSVYDSNWDFAPISEDDPIDYSQAYFDYRDIRDMFLTFFPQGEHEYRRSTRRTMKSIIHIPCIVALDRPEWLKRWLEERKADNPAHFIGIEHARERIKEYLDLFPSE